MNASQAKESKLHPLPGTISESKKFNRIRLWILGSLILSFGLLMVFLLRDSMPKDSLRAPFTEAEAKKAQEIWAQKLGRQVIEEIDLGDGVKMEMVLIPPGSYWMGDSKKEFEQFLQSTPGVENRKVWKAELRPHRVHIQYPFYIGRYEVTEEQYQQIMKLNLNFPAGEGEANQVPGKDTRRFPVITDWADAKRFCSKIVKPNWAKGECRLPSEAEWEYACRAGTQSTFHFGDTLNVAQANFDSRFEDKLGRTEEVGKYGANGFGLYDMHGNVWEWCEDYYGPYDKAPTNGKPQLEKQSDNNYRVLRGGSWDVDSWVCRSAYRFRIDTAAYFNVGYSYSYGFRIALLLQDL
jgi:formylglycine-generating enzyme required for sulfatase activity